MLCAVMRATEVPQHLLLSQLRSPHGSMPLYFLVYTYLTPACHTSLALY